jgi:DNA-directed RNA polymerase specialized sigma24 family protein
MPEQTALLEAHIAGLRRLACVLLRADRGCADDLMQDTLERAPSGWQSRRGEGDLRGWLYMILYHCFLSDQRRQRRRDAHDTLTEVVESALAGRTRRLSIATCCAALPHCLRSNARCCC